MVCWRRLFERTEVDERLDDVTDEPSTGGEAEAAAVPNESARSCDELPGSGGGRGTTDWPVSGLVRDEAT